MGAHPLTRKDGPMKRDPMLTPKQQAMLETIIRFKKEHDGLSPTIRELMALTGSKSTSVVEFHLEGLERGGRIRRIGVGTSRGIAVNGGRWSMEG